jgi:TatD DNase family protein
MLDSHVHLTRFPSPEFLCLALKSAGYEAVSVACAPWEWNAIEKIIPVMGAKMTPAFGLHPMETGNAPADWDRQIAFQLMKYPTAWVGECGLDKRFPEYKEGEAQEAVFERQAAMALSYGRPLVVHCVGDYRRIFEILEKSGYPRETSPILLHRFGGDAEAVHRGLLLDADFSIHKDSLRKVSTRNALFHIPTSHMRYETDADETFISRHFGTEKATPSAIAQKLLEELASVMNAL